MLLVPIVPVSVPLNAPAPVALLRVIVVLLVGLAGVPPASCDCTVTLKAVPAIPLLGTTVNANFVGRGIKVTVAVCVIARLPSAVSVAVKTGEPGVAEVTLKFTTPLASDNPEAAEIVSVAPRLDASVTVLPATGLLLASSKVTVIVEMAAPSAAAAPGAADTVEVPAFTAPAENAMLPLVTGARFVIPAVAVAVKVIVSAFE